MEKLELSGPKNYQEFKEIAKKFTHKDPDGNGQDDTIGLPATSDLGLFEAIFFAYNAYPHENHWVKTEDGNIGYGTVQPEVKEALQDVLQFQEDGLFDPEWVILAGTMVYEDFVSGRCGIVTNGQHWNPIYPLQKSIDVNPEADWDCFDIFTVKGDRAKTAINVKPTKFYFIRKGFEHPEVLPKMVSLVHKYLHSPEQKLYYHTDMEENIEVFKYALYSMNPKGYNNRVARAIVESLNTDRKFEGHGLYEIDRKYFDGVMAYLDGDISRWDMWKTFGPESWNYKSTWYYDNDWFHLNAYYGPVLETWIDKGMTLERIRDEAFATMIADDKSLENWDKFVDNWYKLGGKAATEEANQWWEDIR